MKEHEPKGRKLSDQVLSMIQEQSELPQVIENEELADDTPTDIDVSRLINPSILESVAEQSELPQGE